MKGKHTNAAERRRHLAELESRAETAERRAEKAEAALAALEAKHESAVTGLRRDLAEMRRQRDEAASPEVENLRRQLEEKRLQLRDMAGSKIAFKRAFGIFQRRALAALTDNGWSHTDAEALMAAYHVELKSELSRSGYSPVEVMAEGGEL